MEWSAAVFRIFLYLVAGALLGWNFGNPLAGAALAALLVILFSSYQTWRIWQWLSETSLPPPDLVGVWGEIVARIYKQRRDFTSNQERLQSSVDYLLDSFSAMRDGVVIVEHGGSIRWCNDAAKNLLGLRYPDDIGQAITNLVRVPEFSEYLSAGEYAQPLVFTTAGETQRHLQLMITQFAEGDTLLFLRDVSDRIKTEQMRRDFVGNVSHELRTPLTVITGYLGTFLAEPGNLPTAYVRGLEQMDQQADRMESLLKDLLWLSRIEGDERKEKNEQVDIAALLDELQDEVSNSHPENRLQLELGCRDKVTGDYRELYSAVSNLVFNAFKYSPQEAPVVVSWSRQGQHCHLAVRDKGIGIDPAHFPRLTERFYRVDDSRSSATGGTGLGLAIVKHVAAAHHAQLHIDSELGQGSTFTLVFPTQAQESNRSESC